MNNFKKVVSVVAAAAMVLTSAISSFSVSATGNSFNEWVVNVPDAVYATEGNPDVVSSTVAADWNTNLVDSSHVATVTNQGGWWGYTDASPLGVGHWNNGNNQTASALIRDTSGVDGYATFEMTAPEGSYYGGDTVLYVNANVGMSEGMGMYISTGNGFYYFGSFKDTNGQNGNENAFDIGQYVEGLASFQIKFLFRGEPGDVKEIVYDAFIKGTYLDAPTDNAGVWAADFVSVGANCTAYSEDTCAMNYVYENTGIVVRGGVGGCEGDLTIGRSWINYNDGCSYGVCLADGASSSAHVTFKYTAPEGAYLENTTLINDTRYCCDQKPDFFITNSKNNFPTVANEITIGDGACRLDDITSYVGNSNQMYVKAVFDCTGCPDWETLFSLTAQGTLVKTGTTVVERDYTHTADLFDNTDETSAKDQTYIVASDNMQVFQKSDMGNIWAMGPNEEGSGIGSVTYKVEAPDGKVFNGGYLVANYRACMGAETETRISVDGITWETINVNSTNDSTDFDINFDEYVTGNKYIYVKVITYGSNCWDWALIFGLDIYTSTADHTHVSCADVVTAPTDETTGYTTHTCACGYSFTDTETPVCEVADITLTHKNDIRVASFAEEGKNINIVSTPGANTVKFVLTNKDCTIESVSGATLTGREIAVADGAVAPKLVLKKGDLYKTYAINVTYTPATPVLSYGLRVADSAVDGTTITLTGVSGAKSVKFMFAGTELKTLSCDNATTTVTIDGVEYTVNFVEKYAPRTSYALRLADLTTEGTEITATLADGAKTAKVVFDRFVSYTSATKNGNVVTLVKGKTYVIWFALNSVETKCTLTVI